ncbi:MAG: penicillin-binding transpeptidase domain-containing protein [bacterium]
MKRMNNRRYIETAVLILSLAVLLIYFDRQVIGLTKTALRGPGRKLKMDVEKPMRGNIYSSDSVLIAGSKPDYTVYMNPMLINDNIEHIRVISGLFDISADSIISLLDYSETSSMSNVILKRSPGIELISVLEENRNIFKGITVEREYYRSYVFPEMYCHITGFVSSITKNEYSLLKAENYSPGDIRGRAGVEQQYEHMLRGRSGISYYETDRSGKRVRNIDLPENTDARNGDDVYLTIDHGMQAFLFDLFEEYDSTIVIVMNRKSGAVKAMLVKPYYNPNLFSPIMSRSAVSRKNMHKFTVNRAVTGSIVPGSIIRPFIFNAFTDSDQFDNINIRPCNGELLVGDTVLQCYGSHDDTSLYDMALSNCNILFYQIGIAMGSNYIDKQLRELFPGRVTGIDLPAESGYAVNYSGDRNLNAALIGAGYGFIEMSTVMMTVLVNYSCGDNTLAVPAVTRENLNNTGEKRDEDTASYPFWTADNIRHDIDFTSGVYSPPGERRGDNSIICGFIDSQKNDYIVTIMSKSEDDVFTNINIIAEYIRDEL